VVDWSAAGANLKAVTPPSGTTISFGPDSTITNSMTATFQTPYDLGLLRLLLAPHNATCEGFRDTLAVTLSPQVDMIFVPEVFSPDGNGQNDTWMITCLPTIDPTDYRMQLFNGSGGKVLEMDGLRQDFDGGSLPDGVYWWVLEDQSGKALQNGGLTIRRK
jgi:gliding motility-associated-like protein